MPTALLERARDAGISLWVQDGQLRFRAPKGALTPELREALRTQQNELVALLNTAAPAGQLVLSAGQRRWWFLAQLGAASDRGAHIACVVQLDGVLDVPSLAQALGDLVARHEPLRTGVLADAQGQPVPVGLTAPNTWPLPVDVVDEATAGHAAQTEAALPFDLATGPLMRTRLLRLSPQRHQLVVTVHHIAADGWSLAVLVRELCQRYEGHSLPPLPLRYSDVAHAQAQQLDSDDLSYWRAQLDGLQVPSWPAPPADTVVPSSHTAQLPLPAATQHALGQHAQAGLTPFMLIQSALFVLLARLSGQTDFALGTPVAGRQHSNWEPLVGFFVNTLVLRSPLADCGAQVQQLWQAVQQRSLDALAHQSLPFDHLVSALRPERQQLRNPFFSVALAVQNAPQSAWQLPGLQVQLLPNPLPASRVDLEITAVPSDTGWVLHANARGHAFSPAGTQRLLSQLAHLLGAMLVAPQAAWSALPIEPTAKQALQPGPRQPVPQLTIDAWVAQAAQQHPDRPAVSGNHPLTYAQLNQQATQLAHRLLAQGLQTEERVGICLPRSAHFMVAALGVLRAGAAYVPLDTALPAARMATMCQHAGIRTVVTSAAVGAPLPANVLTLDITDDRPLPTAGPLPSHQPDNLAYVIFTSGSTGVPKGVAVSHRSLANLCQWHQSTYGITEFAHATQLAGLSFDAAAWEIWPYLTAGACLHPVATETVADPARLVCTFAQYGIHFAFLPTPLLPGVLQQPWPVDTPRPLIFTGGERLGELQSDSPWTVINHYGPTEATVVSTAAQASDTRIGQPIGNLSACVLNAQWQPVAVGEVGQLFVGGLGLARGYLGQPGATAARFIPNPFGEPGTRLYATGDRVRWSDDGTLEFVGRQDEQVKIRGHRIELGEVQAALRSHPSVAQALVLVRRDAGPARLAAWVQLQANDTLNSTTPATALPSQRTQEWQDLYDLNYATPEGDATLRIAGWNSSITRQPIPAAEMAAWRDATVARIKALDAARIWEIGCGSGLLLHQLAPTAAAYHATDFSGEVIAQLRQALAGQDHITLEQRLADDAQGIEPASFDAVVINSVVQYFPDATYLQRVLHAAVQALAAPGAVFVGDVRPLALQRAFQTQIQLHHAAPDAPASSLLPAIEQAMAAEKELLLDAAYLRDWAAQTGQVAFVDIQIKQAADRNEMSCYRYDATLYKGVPQAPLQPDAQRNWAELSSWQALQDWVSNWVSNWVRDNATHTLEVTGLPDARTASHHWAAQALPSFTGSVAQLQAAAAKVSGIDPQALWALAAQLGLQLRLAPTRPGCFAALFEPPHTGRPRHWLPATTTEPAQINNPLLQSLVPHNTQQQLASIQAHLKALLPDYMQPAQLVALSAFPLTVNGKIDRTKLLAESADTQPGDAPIATQDASPTEQLLHGIWCDLLGRSQVGLHDNFFSLGGDSILSIQVVSRARQAGLQLAVKDLFEHQTLASLAQVAKTAIMPTEVANDDASDPTPFALSPIQHWFFEQALAQPHHFNQSVLLGIPDGSALTDAVLRPALAALVSQHDALCLGFSQHQGRWLQGPRSPEQAWVYQSVNLATVADADLPQALAAHLHATQASLQLDGTLDGPLVAALRVDLGIGRGARLLLVVHHLLVDAVSWRILIDDLRQACQQVLQGQPVALGLKTTSYRRWLLAAQAHAPQLAGQWPHWAGLANTATQIPLDMPHGTNRVAQQRSVTVQLDATRTQALLHQVGSAWNTDVPDVLLAAMGQALGLWCGQSALLIDLEGHGRDESLCAHSDLSRTVGWFTALYPFALPCGAHSDAVQQLVAVKEALRQVPGKGLGYGLLQAQHPALPARQVAFNYLGQYDGVVADLSPFARASEHPGPMASPVAHRPHAITVGAVVIDGQLQIDWTYSEGLHHIDTLSRLAQDHLHALQALVDALRLPDAGGRSASDFPLAGLSTADIARLPHGGRYYRALYPATALQVGLLSHSWRADSGTSGLYTEQLSIGLQGPLDVAALQQAWRTVVARHEALHSVFVWQGLPQPLVAVLATPTLDWRDQAIEPHALANWLAHDRQTGFDATHAPPLRVSLLALPGDQYRLVWTFHHALLDGWSAFLVLGEVVKAFEKQALPAAMPYQAYARWLHTHNTPAKAVFWRSYLDGLNAPTPLPVAVDRALDGLTELAAAHTAQVQLSTHASSALDALARQCQITPNTVVQAAWALLLASQSGQPEVLFGTTVAARPVELAGAQTAIGLFLNTVPVRVHLNPASTVAAWLQALHSAQSQALAFAHVPLSSMPSWGGQPLFESLVAFENYPVARALQSQTALQVTAVDHEGGTHYPLVLTVIPGSRYSLRLTADGYRYASATAQRLLAQFEHLLQALVAAPEQRLAQIPWLQEGPAVPAIRVDANGFQAIHEQVAQRSIGSRAIFFDNSWTSYAQLETRVAHWAAALQQRGVKPEQRVAIYLQRGTDLIVAMLAVLRCGAAYVPIDPAYPASRSQFILHDAQASLVITSDSLRGSLQTAVAVLTVTQINEAHGLAALPVQTHPDQLAYVIYTSGSTGQPKGVAVTHGNIASLLRTAQPHFGFGPDDVWTLFHSPAFDFSVWEIWGALCHGGGLVVVPYETARSPRLFRQLVSQHGVTVLNQTPTAFLQFQTADAADDSPLKLRWIIFGGEALSPSQLAPWMARHGDAAPALVNMFGITETTVHVTWHRVTHAQVTQAQVMQAGASLIGQALPEFDVQVLDAQLRPVPVGAVGQLYVGGGGVARGYLHQSALTAQRYIPHPFAVGQRLYRSGDLARRWPDGQLEYLGRADRQVKIRGFRIEPDEVAAALRRVLAGVELAVVARMVAGELALVAYLGGPVELNDAALRTALAQHLPDYMLPAAWVRLAALPLTVHGKLDVAALPEPLTHASPTNPAAPVFTDPTQELLAGIWCEVLGCASVAPDDDFFALGGHSLRVAQLMARVADVFGVNLPWSAVFNAPTLAALAQCMASSADDAPPHIASSPLVATQQLSNAYPLSSAQRQLWFVEQAQPGAAYHMPFALRLTGPLNPPALAQALGTIVERHAVLRSRFEWRDDAPWQVVHPAQAVTLTTTDLSHLPAARQANDLAGHLAQAAQRPFSLAHDAPLRAHLYTLADDSHVLLLVLHHIVADGWSLAILVHELMAVYGPTQAPLPALAIQYTDYALWQQSQRSSPAFQASLAYWQTTLAGVPPLNLPTDHPRPAVRLGRGGLERLELAPQASDAVRALARHQGVTLFMVVLASVKAVLAHLTRQTDFAIGVPFLGRSQAALQPLIGHFVNTLPVRLSPRMQDSFEDLLGQVRSAMLQAHSHQQVPFEDIVAANGAARGPDTQPVFQVALSFEQSAPALQLPGLVVQPHSLPAHTAKFDLTFGVTDPSAGALSTWLEYDAQLFEPATAQRFIQCWHTLLHAAIAQPSAPLCNLALLSTEQQQAVLAWRAGPALAQDGATLASLFVQQVAQRPQATALVDGELRYSYAQLHQRAEQVASALAHQGVGVETRVGLCLPRSAANVVATLAVVLAGGTYVPLDPQYPAARLQQMAREARISVLLCGDEAPPWAHDLIEAGQLVALPLDACQGTLPFSPPTVHPSNLAYVMFTSGSTGKPKAIGIEQRSVVDLVRGNNYAQLNAQTVLAHLSSPSFDASTFEIWGALLNGGQLVVVSAETLISADDFAHTLKHHGVTTAFLSTAWFAQLAQARPDMFGGLTDLLVGGQAVPPDAVRRVLASAAPRNFKNVYGPTETTTFALAQTVTQVAEHATHVPIGTPLAATTACVLDSRLQPVPIGVPGEIYLGGSGDARGYLNDAALTATRFVPDPFGVPGQRLYRTGDLGRYNPQGQIEYLGRTDQQVKLRGFRIEPAEVQAAVLGFAGMQAAHVAVQDAGTPHARLVAWFVADAAVPVRELRAHLAQRLPVYMLPSALLQLPALPTTVNGKIDARALPNAKDVTTTATATAPSGTLALVSQAWREVLGTAALGEHDNFFEVGGHSIRLVMLQQRLQTATGREVPIVELFRYPTIAAQALYLDGASKPVALATPADRPADHPAIQDRRAALRSRRAGLADAPANHEEPRRESV